MSNIEWTDATWNPVIGCAKVAQGCKNCYAEKMSKRLRSMGQSEYGDVLTIEGQFNGQIRTRPEMLDKPLRWKKPRMVFVNSMSDLFHKDVPFEFIDQVYAVMLASAILNNRPHTYQVLTKRPERMLEYFNRRIPRDHVKAWAEAGDGIVHLDNENVLFSEMVMGHTSLPWDDKDIALHGYESKPWTHLKGVFPLPNVWHGVSIANQPDADKNIVELLRVPSAIRFVSAEPLVSEVYLQQNWLRASTHQHLRLDIAGALQNKQFRGFMEDGKPMPESAVKLELERRFAAGEKYFPMGDCPEFSTDTGCPGHRSPALDWVIVGGESGPGARPFDIAWARSIIQQCKAANVPVFCKQLGSRAVSVTTEDGEQRYTNHWTTKDRKGGDPEEWPADLRVREFPEAKHAEA